MTNFPRIRPWHRAALAGLGAAALLSSCDATPTTAVVENGLSVPIFQVWWGTTLFSSPVAPGATSEPERTVPATDFAYALIAPGWSVEERDRPSALLALKSAAPLVAPAHHLLTIVVADDGFVGDCAAGRPLPEEDARFIVERIFPGEFAGTIYDSSTCVATPVAADAGAPDAGVPDAGGEGGVGP